MNKERLPLGLRPAYPASVRPIPKKFAFWTPVAMSVLAFAVVVPPAFWYFFRLKHAAHGASQLFFAGGEFQWTVNSDEFLAYSFQIASRRAEKLLVILNSPAHFVDLVVSILSSGRWSSSHLAMIAWRSVTYPLYAIPAWIYVGKGLDALLRNERIGRVRLVTSAVLTALTLFLSIGLWLALPSFEQDGIGNWFIAGMALWSPLVGIYLIAWLRQRSFSSAS